MIGIQVDTSTGWGRKLLTGVFKYKSQQPSWDIWTCPKSFAESQKLPYGMQFDGAIVYIGTEQQARSIARYQIPVINASVFDSEPYGIPNIPPDQDTPVELAYNFFRRRGYLHYAYCGPTRIPFLRTFAQKFKARVEEEGFSCSILNVSASMLNKQLVKLPTPCAIFAWPRTIYQLLAACHALNIRIPEDFAILAQDEDDILNQISSPPLSAIQVPAEQIGYEAARLLHLLLDGKKLPRKRNVPKPREIIERQSTNSLAIDDDKIRAARHFILKNSHQSCTVNEIAAFTGLSRRTLERRFQQLTGRTIAREIQLMRLEKARAMLRTTELPIADIAPLCGFSSTEYFIYVFRKTLKVTPGAYRKGNHG